MKMVVIDRDSLTSQLLTSRLASKGHEVIAEPNKNIAFDLISEGDVDIAFIDPAPLSEARPVIVGLWKALRGDPPPYLMVLSKTASTEDAILSGANDVLNKPFSSTALDTKLANAQRLLDITRQLRIEEDVHSKGGIIGKAAFHQLFLSATDRAFRYGEQSLVVFSSIQNYQEMIDHMGVDEYEEMIDKFTAQMTYMRRQSDVVGRVGKQDFAVLLQRPQYIGEPMDAINRFAETLGKFRQKLDLEILPDIQLRLIDIPQGGLHEECFVPSIETVSVNG